MGGVETSGSILTMIIYRTHEELLGLVTRSEDDIRAES